MPECVGTHSVSSYGLNADHTRATSPKTRVVDRDEECVLSGHPDFRPDARVSKGNQICDRAVVRLLARLRARVPSPQCDQGLK